MFQKSAISVSFMIEHLRERIQVPIEPLNTVDASQRWVKEADLHRPGLALAGFVEVFTWWRVQILGNTEVEYLNYLDPEARRRAFWNVIQFEVPCLILTHGNQLDSELLSTATERGIPVYRTLVPSTRFMYLLRDFLDDQFAPQQTVHGTLVDVYGVGLLLTGPSGIGKSEVALDLVERGHRLVADDVVIVTRKSETVLIGSGTDLVQHFMEIRGLGVLDIRAMFGIRAIRFQKRIEVVVELELFNPEADYTRTGLEGHKTTILDVELPCVKLPIVPGKNVTVICEVIALNYLLKHYGYNAAEEFRRRLEDRIGQRLREKREGIERSVQYFEHDFE
ncbi:MAG: HPr(Ser) kinase/phosphatase [Bacteroidetes bacterium]|nr:HPr(Ser) kinase/phosphatase [Rhodothermia bacterium]MCS7155450.1 HPr(Ser) kinase/phosphatase [Bacteroidota bacterium]MCX7907457.1 HPr(Ser) kinase/phosphatase [Bacteroidota bacterium]MDW8138451.1 HPr(Ser) kinase/phosphatase [Bacteroidota bacterium]MDW8284612.1 HPr(Ser) kinase/phosphatase [Bacteroidota bacterium]